MHSSISNSLVGLLGFLLKFYKTGYKLQFRKKLEFHLSWVYFGYKIFQMEFHLILAITLLQNFTELWN